VAAPDTIADGIYDLSSVRRYGPNVPNGPTGTAYVTEVSTSDRRWSAAEVGRSVDSR
jgi:hypothetical protein